MLKYVVQFTATTLIAGFVFVCVPAAHAQTCVEEVFVNRWGETVVSLVCKGDSEGPSDPGVDDVEDSVSGCWNGYWEVPCWDGDFWWSPKHLMYCKVVTPSNDEPWVWQPSGDPGAPNVTHLLCHYPYSEQLYPFVEYGYDSPVDHVDQLMVMRVAVAKLNLSPPTVGVGAYVYPDARDWGLSWWVGAPMWLWVDATDSHQWGHHSVTVTQAGISISVTATATQVSFDPGDGSKPVTCSSPGNVRVWNPRDLLSRHSPSGCEHTYLQINTLGDKSSRFVVSASVTWSVSWSASTGEAGSFTTTTTSVDNPGIHVGEIHVVRVPVPG